jgi:membrane-bound metal-dependent hydrolase YbcI (DUF457 family)
VITGHLGVAAGARGGWKRASLVWLIAGSVAPDVLDVGYAAVGVCNPDGRYSHTVPIAVLLALLLGGAAYAVTKSRATALATAVMVLLHLPADLVTGYKVYWPGGPLLGLHLYERPLADFVVEALVLTGGWWVLRHSDAGPLWATSRVTLAVLLLAQAIADTAGVRVKPSGCYSVRATAALSKHWRGQSASSVPSLPSTWYLSSR